ncbi:MAG: BNR-repeat neuraminidase N-terminal domain-containing protein [Chitinophagaceae bacterium]
MMAVQTLSKKFLYRFVPVAYMSSFPPNKMAPNPTYPILKSTSKVSKQELKLIANQKLFPGINYFWISIQTK